MTLNYAQLIGGPDAGGLLDGMRNRIINGDMRVDQRNAGAAATPGFVTDRWLFNDVGVGQHSGQQVSDAPPGFSKSLKLTVTTPDTSVTGNDYCQVYQTIEGYTAEDLKWGTADAEAVTISFWVKANVTGTFSLSIRDSLGAFSYVTNYSITAANTWEYKTVTIPGPTSGGTWGTDDTLFGYLTFVTYQGPDSTTSNPDSWQVGGYRAATGITNTWPNTLGNTWQITGIQFEKGEVASDFERLSYGAQLVLCQRYTQVVFTTGLILNATSNNLALCRVPTQVQLRSAPSVYLIDTSNNSVTTVFTDRVTQPGIGNTTVNLTQSSFAWNFAGPTLNTTAASGVYSATATYIANSFNGTKYKLVLQSEL